MALAVRCTSNLSVIPAACQTSSISSALLACYIFPVCNPTKLTTQPCGHHAACAFAHFIISRHGHSWVRATKILPVCLPEYPECGDALMPRPSILIQFCAFNQVHWFWSGGMNPYLSNLTSLHPDLFYFYSHKTLQWWYHGVIHHGTMKLQEVKSCTIFFYLNHEDEVMSYIFYCIVSPVGLLFCARKSLFCPLSDPWNFSVLSNALFACEMSYSSLIY